MKLQELNDLVFGGREGLTRVDVPQELRQAIGAKDDDELVLAHHPLVCALFGHVASTTPERFNVPESGLAFVKFDTGNIVAPREDDDLVVGTVESLTLGERLPDEALDAA